VEPLAKAAGERASGDQVSRPRSLLVAAVVGFAAATLTYRVLRTGSSGAAAGGGSG
jgi:hypothetical protein